jgi:hypothetical protein
MTELSDTKNARDKRIRKALKRHGYFLIKSRTKIARDEDQGLYRIGETSNNAIAWGPKFELDLETVEAIIESLDARDGRADPAQLEGKEAIAELESQIEAVVAEHVGKAA